MKFPRTSLMLLLGCALLGGCCTNKKSSANEKTSNAPATIELTKDWRLICATNVTATGEKISTTKFNVSKWYPITIPSTVMAGLVANGVYTNIYFGQNMKSVPDLSRRQWWYRGEFVAPKNSGGEYWLKFKGIAYKAEIWLNGKLLDTNAEGTMVSHEYNVTDFLQPNGKNVLALKITPPNGGKNLSFWYVDWNPPPPDDNGGIWGKVLLEETGPVALRDPFVKTVLPLPKTDSADLTVYVDAENGTAKSVSGILTATISKPGCPTINVEQPVTLSASERREISFAPENFKQLHMENPALWWPFQMGKPERYDLNVSFHTGEKISASQTIKFGIRQITQYQTPEMGGKPFFQGFEVNGKNFLVRGGAYCWDLFMRFNTNVDETHMAYAKDMGLNTIRFEGILGNEDIYDIADREGIMLIPGFVCCSRWEQWPQWTTNDFAIAYASLDSQMRNMRAHPSALVWLFGSDKTPLDTEEKPVLRNYKAIAEKLHWQNATVNSAGQDGIKMEGPYVWEPPAYWYEDKLTGGAFGFCAEEGGETPPPAENLKKFIPPDELWPMKFGTNSSYTYHAGKGGFSNIKTYNAGLENRYGASSNLDDYSAKSQLQNYEAARGQFESMAMRAYNPETKTGAATGTIFWMMDNSWPTIHWNLYDYYFKPAGSFFGAKKANAPVQVMWDYDTKKVSVFNSTLNDYSNLTVIATVHTIPDLSPQYSNAMTLDVPADLTTEAFTIPEITNLSKTYFVRLQLKNAELKTTADNLYWYSTQPDVFNFAKSDWYITPLTNYADLSGLNDLVKNSDVKISVTQTNDEDDGKDFCLFHIELSNANPTNIAFFVHAEVLAGEQGDEIAPIQYSDNYISLWPGETKTILAKCSPAQFHGKSPFIKIKGFNVPETLVRPPSPSQTVADKKIKVLVLTGGHGFNAAKFFKMFSDNPEITFVADKQIKAAEGYDRPDLYNFDVIVLYDAPTNITEIEKARFLKLFDKGIGVVVLHHAYLAYPLWPEFGRIAGGRYLYWDEEVTNGVTMSDYKSKVRIPVTVVGKNPVIAGMNDFVLTNELYLNMNMAGNSKPLLKTGDEWLAWYRTEKKSRVVGTVLGHDCYDDPNFRQFVAQSIRWAAKR